MPKKNNPGCNCCGCPITSDNFNRADDTDIDTGSPCGWTETGDASIVSNELSFNTAGTIALCDTAHPDGDPFVRVIVKSKGADGRSLRVLVDYTDASNYLGVELEHGERTGANSPGLRIFQKVAGVETVLNQYGFDVDADDWSTLTVNFGEDQHDRHGISAHVITASSLQRVLSYDIEPIQSSGTVALMSGTAGAILADDFELEKLAQQAKDQECPSRATACVFLFDEFTDSDDTDIGQSYTETTGDFQITSNKLDFPAGASQLDIETLPGFDTDSVYIFATIEGATDDILSVWIGAEEVEVKFGASGYVKLISPTSGTTTSSGSIAVSPSTHLLEIWKSREVSFDAVLCAQITSLGLGVLNNVAPDTGRSDIKLTGDSTDIQVSDIEIGMVNTDDMSDCAERSCRIDCTSCCGDDDLPAIAILDLGAGGWTIDANNVVLRALTVGEQSGCIDSYIDDIPEGITPAGVYGLEPASYGGGCSWELYPHAGFAHPSVFTATNCRHWQGGTKYCLHLVETWIRLLVSQDRYVAGDCWLVLLMDIGSNNCHACGGGSCTMDASRVTYEAEIVAPDHACGVVTTLNKLAGSENENYISTPYPITAGSAWPATVTIDLT